MAEPDNLKLVDSTLTKCITIPLTVIFLLFVAPPFALLTIGFYLYRVSVIYYAKATHGQTSLKEFDLLSSLFAGMDDIFHDPFNVMVGIQIFEGTADLDVVQATVRDQLLHKMDPETGEPFFAPLLQPVKYIGGIPFWNRSTNLTTQKIVEECVKFYDPADGLGSYDISRLLDFSKEFIVKPFSKELPLWEMIVIPNYVPDPVKDPDLDPEKSYFAFIPRMHHCLCDGVSLIWLAQDLSLNPQKERMPLFNGEKKAGRKTFKSWLRVGSKCIQAVHELISEALQMSVITSGSPLWPANPDSPSGNVEGAGRLSVGQPALLHMNDINEIKLTHKTSGMGVILLGIMRALRKTLLQSEGPIPSYSQLMMPVPIPRGDGKMKNRFTFCTLYIPTFIEDPKVHLQEIDKVFVKVRDSTQPHMHAFFMNISGILPRQILRYFHTRNPKGDGIGLSSLMGPKELTNVFGCPLKRCIVSSAVPLKQKFATIYFSSLDGRAYCGCVADINVIPSDNKAVELANRFIEELDILRDKMN